MRIPKARFFWGFVTGFIVGPIAALVLLYGYNHAARRAVAGKMDAPVLPMALEAEYDWTLETLAGEPFDFSELEGKVVFLTVWRAGCEFCEAELPFLQELYEKTREDGVAFAVVATAKDERILDLVAEHALTFPMYIFEGERPKVYQTGIIPSTFILSPEGKLAFRFRGPARWDDDTCVTFMKNLAHPDARTAEGVQ